jgi:hypothetical protein
LRSLQCSSHNDEALYDRKLTWIPHHDSVSPCSLYCQANGTDIIHLFSQKVLDGTRCYPTGFDHMWKHVPRIKTTGHVICHIDIGLNVIKRQSMSFELELQHFQIRAHYIFDTVFWYMFPHVVLCSIVIFVCPLHSNKRTT